MEHNWITSTAVHDYASNYSEPECAVLKALNEETQANVRGAQMLSGALQGAFLTMIAQIVQPKFILELGTYTGYSAICLAKGLAKDGELHSIDIDDKLKAIREKYWEQAGLQNQIIQHIGPALQVMPTLKQKFDLVFLDADKRNYIAYFDLLMEMLPVGALILADNVMFHGEVLLTQEEMGKNAKHMAAFNEHVKAAPNAQMVMLPIRDGISLIRKIK